MTPFRHGVFCERSGIAAGHIAVGGDSAGGGLTVALINRLRDAGERIPGCAWLISPWTDLTLSGSTLATKDAVDPIIHKAYLAELADAYLPPETFDRRDPRVSPLFADLSGLPPTLIQVGACETLLEDSTRFARAAGAANVAVTLQIWPDMIHAFPMWNAHLEPGRRALAEAGRIHSPAVAARNRLGRRLQRRPARVFRLPPKFLPVVQQLAAAGGALHSGNTFPETVMTC